MTPRQTRTPQARAQDDLDAAQRLVDRLSAARDKAAAEVNRLGPLLQAAVAERDYRKGAPALRGAASGDDVPPAGFETA